MQDGREVAAVAGVGPGRSGRRAWPFGLLGMLALIAVVEGALARQPDLKHAWAADWVQAVQAVPRFAPTTPILCFGDSLIKYGINAPILSDRLKRPAHSFAMGGSPPLVTLAMLRRALATGARPEAILVEFAPHFLSESPTNFEVLLPEVLDPSDVVQLGRDARDPILAARLLLAWCLPSVRNRLEVRSAISARLAGDARLDRSWHLAAGRRNWMQNLGSHAALRTPRAPGDDLAWASTLYPAEWHVDPVNALAVRRFLRLTADRQIPVFWVIPPLSPEVHARRAAIAGNLDTRYDRYLARMQAKFPGLTILDGRASGYDATVHTDPLHLDRRGSGVFTEDVAAVVRDRLAHPGGAGQRVTLPPFRDRPADQGLEDNFQSLLATREHFYPTRR